MWEFSATASYLDEAEQEAVAFSMGQGLFTQQLLDGLISVSELRVSSLKVMPCPSAGRC